MDTYLQDLLSEAKGNVKAPTADPLLSSLAAQVPAGTTSGPQQGAASSGFVPKSTAPTPSPLGFLTSGTGLRSLGDEALNFDLNAGRGIENLGLSGAQLLANILPTPGFASNINKIVTQRQQQQLSDPNNNLAAKAGRFVGNQAPLLFIAPELKAGSFLEGLLNSASLGALGSAANPVAGATSPSDFDANKLSQLGTGALSGGLLHGAVSGVSNVLAPPIIDAARSLQNLGVKLSIPQQLGGPIAFGSRFIEKRIPFVGSGLKNATAKSVSEFNQGLFDQVARQVGGRVDQAGHEGFSQLKSAISNGFEDVLPKIEVNLGKDEQFGSDISNILADARPRVRRENFNVLKAIVGKNLAPELGGTPTSGEVVQTLLRRLESEKGRFGRSANAQSPDPDSSVLRDALDDVKSSVLDTVSRQNPDVAPSLAKLKEAFMRSQILQNAVTSPNALKNEGVFGPGDLLRAARSADTTRNRVMSATGNAFFQKLATDAGKVLGFNPSLSGDPVGSAILGTTAGVEGLNNLQFFAEHPAVGAASIPLLFPRAVGGLLRRPAFVRGLKVPLQRASGLLSLPVGGTAGLLAPQAAQP